MRKVLQLPAIGVEGRFANWMLHYLAGKLIAERFGAVLETPPWIGETLFQISEHRITKLAHRMRVEEVGEDWEGVTALPPFFDIPHRVLDPMITRENVQKVFQWRETTLHRIVHGFDVIPHVSVHVRRGDYGILGFPIVEEEHLQSEVIRHGFDPRMVWWIREESPHDFHRHEGDPPYLLDFQLLEQSRNVFVYPRSTFSQMAALLGTGNIYMPYDYTNGKTTCRFELHDPTKPCLFPSRNNSFA